MAQQREAQILTARKAVRRVRNAARAADQALAGLDGDGVDVHGSYVIAAGEDLDVSELADFVQLAVGENPGAEIEVIIVVAHPGTDKETA